MRLMEVIEQCELEPKNLTVEELFHVIIHELGFPSKIKGTRYLEEFFALAYERYENPCDIEIMKLYGIIAANNNTTVASVSRQMLYAITVAWDKGNHDLQNQLFIYTVNPETCKPTLQELVAVLMEILKE